MKKKRLAVKTHGVRLQAENKILLACIKIGRNLPNATWSGKKTHFNWDLPKKKPRAKKGGNIVFTFFNTRKLGKGQKEKPRELECIRPRTAEEENYRSKGGMR